MKTHLKDKIWLWVLAASLGFFINVFIQVVFHKHRNANENNSLAATAQKVRQENNTWSFAETDPDTIDFNQEKMNVVNMPFELKGTITGNVPLAFINNLETAKQGVYKLNDYVEGYRVTCIAAGMVAMEKDGFTSILSLKSYANKDHTQNNPVVYKDNAGALVISKSALLGNISKINDMLTKVTICPLPDSTPNTLKGFRIDNVPSGSIIEQAGIKSGDIVYSVQGRKLQSVQDALQMFNAVQAQPSFEVVLLRDEQQVKLKYEIK